MSCNPNAILYNDIQQYGGQCRQIHDPKLRKHVMEQFDSLFFSHITDPTMNNKIIPTVRPTILTKTIWNNVLLTTNKRYLWQEKTKGQESYLLFTQYQDKPFVFIVIPSLSQTQWKLLLIPNLFAPIQCYKGTLIYGTLAHENDDTNKWIFHPSDLIQISGSWDVPHRTYTDRNRMMGALIQQLDYDKLVDQMPPCPFRVSLVKRRALLHNNEQTTNLLQDSIAGSSHSCSGLILVEDEAHGGSIGISSHIYSWEPMSEKTCRLVCRLQDDRALLYALKKDYDMPNINNLVLVSDQNLVETFGSALLHSDDDGACKHVNECDDDDDDDDGDGDDDGDENMTKQEKEREMEEDVILDYDDAILSCKSSVIVTMDDLWKYSNKTKHWHGSTIEFYWNHVSKLWHFKTIQSNAPPMNIERVRSFQVSFNENEQLSVEDLQSSHLSS